MNVHERRRLEKVLRAQGYTGWCSHLTGHRCIRKRGQFCLTCDGPLSQLAKNPSK